MEAVVVVGAAAAVAWHQRHAGATVEAGVAAATDGRSRRGAGVHQGLAAVSAVPGAAQAEEVLGLASLAGATVQTWVGAAGVRALFFAPVARPQGRAETLEGGGGLRRLLLVTAATAKQVPDDALPSKLAGAWVARVLLRLAAVAGKLLRAGATDGLGH